MLNKLQKEAKELKLLFDKLCPKFPLDEITYYDLDVFIKNYKKQIPKQIIDELELIKKRKTACPDIHVGIIAEIFLEYIREKIISKEKYKNYPKEAVYILESVLFYEKPSVKSLKWFYNDEWGHLSDFDNYDVNIEAALDLLIENNDIVIDEVSKYRYDFGNLPRPLVEIEGQLILKPFEDDERIVYINNLA